MIMQQLSGLDTLFVRCDVGNSHLHVGPVMIYVPPTPGNGAPDFRDVQKLLDERLCRWEVLRRKLVEVPLKLDNPYWTEDSDFSLKNHVRRSRLRKPGNLRQFCREIARIHAQPLNMTRPLWMAHVIYGLDDMEGLPPGSFAIYFKTHHATMDGATGARTIKALHDPEPNNENGAQSDKAVDNWQAGRDPSTLGLLSRALVNNIRKPFKLAAVAGQAATAVQRVNKGTRENRFSSLGGRERTRFNGNVGPDRVVGFVKTSLAEVKEVRRLVPGATVNDVTLSIVSGALRRYLNAHGELPDKALIAGIPVDVRAQQQRESGGNVISVMTVSLCTDIGNSLECLEAVHQQTLAAKAYHHELGPELVTNVTDSLPPYLVALCVGPFLATGLLGKTSPIVNTIVSNVPGPPKSLFFGGAELTMITGMGPCADGLGLFHTVSSYCDVITISFQACPTMLPDPEFYTSCIQASWDDLKAVRREA
jgi:WS/DGAT/MGAT family acyltransferase